MSAPAWPLRWPAARYRVEGLLGVGEGPVRPVLPRPEDGEGVVDVGLADLVARCDVQVEGPAEVDVGLVVAAAEAAGQSDAAVGECGGGEIAEAVGGS